jgi:mannose-6-phosphate isomerase-like protein (cupin superfamily)
MKAFLALTMLTVISILMTAQGPQVGTIYVDRDKVTAAASKGGGILARAADVPIQVAAGHRNTGGMVEWHEKVTEVYYVVEGEATMVTGGTMVDAKVTRPGQQSASDITGGQTQVLRKGDGMVIPAGTPHWFKEVQAPITYYVVMYTAP